jgi:hypothetical protein
MRRWLGVLAFTLVCGLCSAQDETNSVPAIAWLQGPVTGELARVSTLKIPEGFIFTGSDGTKLIDGGLGQCGDREGNRDSHCAGGCLDCGF